MDRATREAVPDAVRPFLDAFARILARQAIEQLKREAATDRREVNESEVGAHG